MGFILNILTLKTQVQQLGEILTVKHLIPTDLAGAIDLAALTLRNPAVIARLAACDGTGKDATSLTADATPQIMRQIRIATTQP